MNKFWRSNSHHGDHSLKYCIVQLDEAAPEEGKTEQNNVGRDGDGDRGTLAVDAFSKMRKYNRPGLLCLGSPEIMQESRCLSPNQGTFDTPIEKKRNVNWKKSSMLNDQGPEALTNGED